MQQVYAEDCADGCADTVGDRQGLLDRADLLHLGLARQSASQSLLSPLSLPEHVTALISTAGAICALICWASLSMNTCCCVYHKAPTVGCVAVSQPFDRLAESR